MVPEQQSSLKGVLQRSGSLQILKRSNEPASIKTIDSWLQQPRKARQHLATLISLARTSSAALSKLQKLGAQHPLAPQNACTTNREEPKPAR